MCSEYRAALLNESTQVSVLACDSAKHVTCIMDLQVLSHVPGSQKIDVRNKFIKFSFRQEIYFGFYQKRDRLPVAQL